MTKTDFCSSPALKQFTIHYLIDEMLKAVDVVRSVAHYAVTYGRDHSPLGRWS